MMGQNSMEFLHKRVIILLSILYFFNIFYVLNNVLICIRYWFSIYKKFTDKFSKSYIKLSTESMDL